jgi:decaprenyl-phosphate phosphoribosyltransferase
MISAWLKLLRPTHWVKNLFVLAPVLFARGLFTANLFLTALLACGIFCVLSSSVYIINDVMDAEQDRSHPLKSHRPVACGLIDPGRAIVVGILLALGSLLPAFALDTGFGLLGTTYLAVNLLYSRWLKRLAFVDVAVIAFGFVLRVISGSLAIGVAFSSWLVVCTFCLASLLAIGKRRHELEICGKDGQVGRQSLTGYTRASLRWTEWILAGVTVAAYIAYTLAPGTRAKFGSFHLLYTLPFPVFGIVRYLRLVVTRREKVPTEALVTDIPSLINLAGWVVTVVLIIYDVV